MTEHKAIFTKKLHAANMHTAGHVYLKLQRDLGLLAKQTYKTVY